MYILYGQKGEGKQVTLEQAIKAYLIVRSGTKTAERIEKVINGGIDDGVPNLEDIAMTAINEANTGNENYRNAIQIILRDA